MTFQPKIAKYFNETASQWLDLLREGIVVLDESRRLVYANPAFLSYSRLDFEKCRGKDWAEIRPNAVCPKVYASGLPVYNYHRVLDDNTESYIDIIPFKDEAEIIGVLIVVRDIQSLGDLMRDMREMEKHTSARLNEKVKGFYHTRYSFENIVGADAPHAKLARRSAQTDNSVLLIGESGTGKEVIAQSIHHESPRSEKPFVDINCASLPEALLESELFGYVSGAFTGASKNGKIGLFELADGGTLFLDEITEIPIPLQSKLLRALQERQIRRVGDNKNIQINVRVIAATNQNLEKAMAEKRFRQDLFYRLAVVAINIPPLRERKEDFDDYVAYFLQALNRQYKKKFSLSKELRQLLMGYSWPGNVRELQNVLEYCCMVAPGELIGLNSLPDYIRKDTGSAREQVWDFTARPGETLNESLRRVEREIICNMLEHYGPSTEAKRGIARVLGISVATLYNKMKKLDISTGE